jgi:hypothetical protein
MNITPLLEKTASPPSLFLPATVEAGALDLDRQRLHRRHGQRGLWLPSDQRTWVFTDNRIARALRL